MKVGILTHHYINNYGAFLQAYALQQAVTRCAPGAQVQVIDYVNRAHFLINSLGWLRCRPGRDDLRRWLQKSKMPRLFAQARQRHLCLSPRVYTAEEINALGYDVIIVGSDEVWNWADRKSADPVKFGEGLTSRLTAYAPSVGQALTAAQEIPEYVKRGLPRFDRLSARDDTTEELARRIGCTARRVLDPTFLTPIPTEPVPCARPYILFYYCQGLPAQQLEAIRDFAAKEGLALYGAGESGAFFTGDTIRLTPFQWAGMFAQASYVVTGTFHGVVFSLLNQKPFLYCTTIPSRIAKVASLLREFDLESRSLPSGAEAVALLKQPIDAAALKARIQTMAAQSEAYLADCLVPAVRGAGE